ncbi:DUF3575 domain-containing protein [Bacteroides sp. OttesenSCG-928-D19]|nr:DUF3575 domain-containing protein [Bacteroides sp. OttesenSCG-928-N06]MDL2305451.1 DUF3575 domain-containing protein [Bacteroides sp. OttesenSCG-928-D19]
MKKHAVILLFFLLQALLVGAQTSDEADVRTFVFSFEPGSEVFLRQTGDNATEIDVLFDLIDRLRLESGSNDVPMRVNSYTASRANINENTLAAIARARQVKSFIILKKGAKERDFTTRTSTKPWAGKTDVVVVTLQAPKKQAPKETNSYIGESKPDITATPVKPLEEAEAELKVEKLPVEVMTEPTEASDYFVTSTPVRASEPAKTSEPKATTAPATTKASTTLTPTEADSRITIGGSGDRKKSKAEKSESTGNTFETRRPAARKQSASDGHTFYLRTNMLYDVALLPNIGFEWKIASRVGIKVDAGTSYWGSDKGFVQKMYLVNPEVRCYLLQSRNLYVGASFNYLKYNAYDGLMGLFFPEGVGYQGHLWNAGITMGYQLPISSRMYIDFNLGLGYSKVEHDSFTVVDEVRYARKVGQSFNFYGPTQAGITLVWRIGR